MLDALMSAARRIGAHDQTGSIGIEAFDYMEQMIERIIEHHDPSSFQNQLDNNLQMVRKKTISKLLAEITGVRYELSYRHDDVIEKVIRLLTRMRQTIFELAQDVQSSIPSIVVKMMSHSKMIGYVKIPVHEVFCAEYDALSGEWCGRVRAIPLRWPASFDRKHRREEFPAVLHVRMWFGSERRERLLKWKQSIEPAELKSFVEIFQIQKRSLVTKQWKAAEKAYTDEDGEDCKDVLGGVAGLTFVGNWVLKNTHDTWMSQICGRPTVEDKALEVERREPNNAWKFYKYTGYFGNEIPIQQMEKAPKGWEYSSKWVLDKHRNNGDKYGWVYSTTGVFWGDHDAVDREMRPEHKYRRRFITRVRRATTYSKDNEKLETYQDSLGDVNWEHAPRRNTAFHDLEQPSDTIRRRRFMIEVEQDKDANEDDLTRHRPMQRLYEAHLLTTRWQLRCYIMWAKDLLPIVKNSSRAFVRIFFAYQAQQTLVVENSQNPIWNETIIFESVLIPGGMREISTHPPVVHVEVRGERTNDTEVHLGRFKASPTVITSPADSRAVPVWSPLTFHKGHTRGSVLACFEMFQHEKGKDNLPVAPEKKVNYQSRLEIPKEMRPHFAKFSVQFLCWGVRNLSKYQLLSVRRPFVEVTIGDVEMQLEPLKNVAKDPNFPEPMITFPEVSLPVALELSPPLVVSLYDSRAFRRRPLIGVCLISDFNKYIRSSTSRKDKQKAVSWEEFDRYLDLEDEKLVDTNFIPTLRQEGMPHLDWWSKYYSSLGQFQRAPGYEESGMEYLQVLKSALEDVKGYNNFGDFLDTFSFVKSTRGDFDDPEEKQKTGELKARLLITPIDGKESQDVVDPPGVEFVGPVNCLVRVYVIEANGLVTNRKSGVCDPYITVRCGKQQVNLKKNYRADTTDPLFGERIDLNVTIPVEKDLKISIMDKRRLLADEEIGTTTIDLENRLLTKWRATTGLSKQYTIQGEMPWRDQLTPLATLKRYCTKMLLPAPYTLKRKSSVNGAEDEQGISLLGVQFWYSDVLNSLEREEMEMVQHQRESAGKEPNADVDEKTDTSAKRTLKNAEKEDENKFANWDLVEVERTLGKKSKDTGTKDSLKELRNQNRRQILGSQLQTVALYVLQQMNLVPEHVETRFLHAPMSGTAQCGKLRLFVDILPLELGVIPAPLNIAPRQPERYQLRIAVQNVAGAIPVKRSFGEPVGDLYVKAFVNGMSKGDKTDVHYRSKFLIDWQMELFRSLDGFGEFNWRFLLELDFNPWERKLVSYQKTRFFRKAREELVDPLVIVQLWDKNKMRKDNMLGEIVLDLTNFLEGIANPEDVGIFAKKDRKVRCKCCSRRCCLIRCCIFCKETRCLCGIRKSKKKPFPRPPKYVEPEEGMEHLSLFEAQSVKGWWPMLTSTAPNSDEAAAKKKDDDFSEGQQFVMGLVEMELSLVTLEEAIADPVGRKRKEPNHSPYLAKPHRSKWNSFWFTSRIRPCISWFWHRFGLQLLLLILLVLFIFVAVYALVYNWPLIVMHIVG